MLPRGLKNYTKFATKFLNIGLTPPPFWTLLKKPLVPGVRSMSPIYEFNSRQKSHGSQGRVIFTILAFSSKNGCGPVGALRRSLYIEMAPSYHQPHEHHFVAVWKLIFGKKWAVAGHFFINPDDSKGLNDQNIGAVAAINLVFPVARLKRVV